MRSKHFAAILLLSLSLTSVPNCFAYDIPNAQTYSQGLIYRGVSLEGGAFVNGGDGKFQPKLSDAALFIYQGMNVYRIPIAWEYLADINGSFLKDNLGNATQYQKNIDQLIADLSEKKATIIIDLHNYMRFNPGDISLDYKNRDANGSDIIGYGGGATPSQKAYFDLWNNIAKRYHGPNIIYAIMNEPHDLAMEKVVANENQAIAGIRSAEYYLKNNNPHLILIDGNYWSGLHSWHNKGAEHEPSNADTFPGKIEDPGNNFAIDVHQYFDEDSSGTYPTKDCLSPSRFQQEFKGYWPKFVGWAKQNQVKVFLGEFGSPDTANCRSDTKFLLDNIAAFAYQEQTKSGFIGWAAWAAGSSWGDYVNSIAPGGPANSLAHDFYPNYLTKVSDLPSLGTIIAKLTNNSNTTLFFSSGNWPFQKKGSATIKPGESVTLYSEFNPPASQYQLTYHQGNDNQNVMGFGVTVGGYGFSYNQIQGIKIIPEKQCSISGQDRCWKVEN